MVQDKSNRVPIPHNRPTLGMEEEAAAIKTIQSGWVAQGKEVERFENEFCRFLGLPLNSAVAVSSGTAALFLALLSLGAKGKEVSFPALSCSALRNATVMADGIPHIVDSEQHSPNMNLSQISSSSEIAIVPHMFGIPQRIENMNSNLRVIEDCAQSLGAMVNEAPVGLQGDVGVFSFFATKLMTTGGQGGMVVSKDRSLIEFIKDYRLFDRREDHKIRFNFQMTDLQAAIGRIQLQKLYSFLNRRNEIYLRYEEANLPMLSSEPGILPVRFRAILQTTKQREVIKALEREAITSVIPVQSSELLGSQELYPNAYNWTRNTVSLPIYPTLTDGEVRRIIQVVSSVL